MLRLRRKITLREMVKLHRYADGSLNALGFVVNAVGFGTFSRNEARRLAKPDHPGMASSAPFGEPAIPAPKPE